MKSFKIVITGTVIVLSVLIISIYTRYDFLYDLIRRRPSSDIYTTEPRNKAQQLVAQFIKPNSLNSLIDAQPVLSSADYDVAVHYSLSFDTPFIHRGYTLKSPEIGKFPLAFETRSNKQNSCFQIKGTGKSAAKDMQNAVALPMRPESSYSSPDRITHLLFWIYSRDFDNDLGVALWNIPLSPHYPLRLIPINRYINRQQHSGWQPVIIPVNETNFSPSGTELPTISFFFYDAPKNIYIDSIQLCTVTDLAAPKKFLETLYNTAGRNIVSRSTNHFQVYSSYNAYMAEQAGRCCELVLKDLDHLFAESVFLEQKVMVVVFSNRQEFTEFLKKLHYNPDHSRAIYMVKNNVSFIATYIDKDISEAEVYATLVHETTHLFLKKYFGTQHIPLWLTEGLAMYYEHTTFEYGNIDSQHKKRMFNKAAQQGICSLASLFTVFNARYTNELFSVQEKYLYAYSLIAFLSHSNMLKPLLLYLKQGYSPAQSFTLLFDNSLEQAEREWDAFLALSAKK